MKIRVRAPSNIALIKYMGKTDSSKNIPENPSLSMTLNRLSTYLELDVIEDGAHRFVLDSALPALPAGTQAHPVSFNEKAVAKFENHFRRVQSRMTELGAARTDRPSATVRSVNTFPAGSGIASSASSFAALTLGAFLACSQDIHGAVQLLNSEKSVSLRRKLAKISREGSGSSCRSFEGPWVQWQGEDVSLVESRFPEMAHFVVVVSAGEKKISSSEAHLRVKTSPLWSGRIERAGDRFEKTRRAIESGDVAAVSRLAWNEMWEMHSLFHTSSDPFTYWEPQTIDALHFLGEFLKSSQPPIVTLDAGPNVHLLVAEADRRVWRDRLIEKFGKNQLLEDGQGTGAEVLGVETR